MKTIRHLKTGNLSECSTQRSGSTLVVVIALLGLLMFLGMVFFTFASQEREAAEYFSEAAKATMHHPGGVWPHMLEQLLVGPSEKNRGSILYSPTRRHSMIRNLVGSDVYPHNGDSIDVAYDSASGEPTLTKFVGTDLLDFVDSPAARGEFYRRQTPEPDVDYTYPDINNLFLAHKGWAIREDANGQLSQTRVILPSFFRPQYLRRSASVVAGDLSAGFQRSFGGLTADVPTNPHWAYAYQTSVGTSTLPTPVTPDSHNRDSTLFATRSFRPHPSHLAGIDSSGTPVRRYLTHDEANTLGVAAGGFPFLPEDGSSPQEGGGNGIRGDLGIWTGSPELAYELDADNDGDGITEGIWLDLGFPIQEDVDSSGAIRSYAVLHSMTVYDLDGLFNLNVHGNLAGLPRTDTNSSGGSVELTLAQAFANGHLSDNFLSRSHHGLGPSEVNPIWGLRRESTSRGAYASSVSDNSLAHMYRHFNATPGSSLELANMEWVWLLTGRGDYKNHSVTRNSATGVPTAVSISDLQSIKNGRWGEANILAASLNTSPSPKVVDLPRPGRSGHLFALTSNGVSFGGRQGFDDNQNWMEGEGFQNGGVLYQRPFGHPVSFSGIGRRTQVDDPVFNSRTNRFEFGPGIGHFSGDSPLFPILLRPPNQVETEQFPAYLYYGRSSSAGIDGRYVDGPNGTFDGTHVGLAGVSGDDLSHAPTMDELFEDPLETIFDHSRADHNSDSIASIGDLVSLQWPQNNGSNSLSNSQDRISVRIPELAMHSLGMSSPNREMFTTHSNSLRHIPKQRNAQRPWEFSADTDGGDRNNDGFGDGDGRPEFPPAFGSTPSSGLPFSLTDPFRAPVRRMLMNEAGETGKFAGCFPLSINHIVDVDRLANLPAEGTAAYRRHMRRSGLRFRALTEHPIGTDSSQAGRTVLDTLRVHSLEATSDSDANTYASAIDVAFPPRTAAEQEFWARRDRQQLARDIYVLLYTIGGAEQGTNGIRNYTGTNDPSASTALYSHDQLRRMAQFAVNMVDAMDTDSAITKFEYDKNLGDGWNLDDDPFTTEFSPPVVGSAGTPDQETYNSVTGRGMYPEDSQARGVVFGVESQCLAFNEVLAARCEQTQQVNHAATLHDDTQGTRDHLFVELRNTQPQSVALANSRSVTPETGIYRIARFDRPVKNAPLAAPDAPVAAVTFQVDAGQIAGGGAFTIASASDSAVASSDLYVDWDLDNTYDLIAPNVNAQILPTGSTSPTDASAPALQPRTNLDLIHPSHSRNRFAVTESSQTIAYTPGAFLKDLSIYYGNTPMDELSKYAGDAGGDFEAKWSDVGFDLVLQRRLNPNLPSVESSFGQTTPVNPWVEIDRVRVEFDRLDIQDSDTVAELTGTNGRLANVRSFERKEPLDDNTRQRVSLPLQITNYRFNSIGSEYNTACLRDPVKPRDETTTSSNYNPLEYSELWQPHFDRDFVSAAELLNVPVFGPRLLTQRLNYSRLSPQQQTILDAEEHQVSGAAAMFLRPEFSPATSGNTQQDNRWYRLFQFVEVPSRVHRMLGNYLNQTTVPGRINLNTIRHQEVLAGLIDDPMFADLYGNRLASPFLTDSTPGTAGRDRWTEFVRERDGIPVNSYFDPTPNAPGSGDEATRFLIPGTPGSRPFRSYGFTANTNDDNGMDHTILRRLSDDRDEDNDGDDDELEIGAPSDDDDGDLLPDDGPGGGADATNRHWLEVGSTVTHEAPTRPTTTVERHQILSKIMNNTTTVSNVFVIFATAAYFEAHEDPASGLYRIGGRIDLEGSDGYNPGWQQRAVFVVDRTEAMNTYDAGSQNFNWQQLIKYEATIE